jgi:mRNA-degrading endonuclease toxin of MazEF toxin-antitoxin module
LIWKNALALPNWEKSGTMHVNGREAGVVGADQVKNMDWRARKATRIGTVPEDVVVQVVKRLQALLEQ